MKKRYLISAVVACLLLAILIWFLGLLLTPKFVSEQREGSLIGEYYSCQTSHDVLFVGDCEVYENFTPPTLWEEYGITSYIRGSAQQLTWQSYYLLEEMLRTETPRVVVFNVLALKYGEGQNEAYNRMTLDGMRWSSSKWKSISESMTEGESFLSYLVPLLRYHDRWSDLKQEDLTNLFSKKTVSHQGYLMQTGVDGGYSEREGMPLADEKLPDKSMEYLEKMRVLCEENGVQLILIKAPTNNWKYYWYDAWDKQVSDYADRNALPYYNFIPKTGEIGIDWETDTYDKGVHLNVWGAEKLTSYFGKILSETFGIPDHREDEAISNQWNAILDDYKHAKNEEKSS